MAARMNLTAKAVAGLEPADTDKIIWDEKLRGFGVRVFPSGTRKWLIQYRNNNGQTRRLALGAFPKLTAEKAREAAMKHFAAIIDGADPSWQKQAHREALTVSEMCDAYMQACEDGLVVSRRREPKKPLTIYTDRGRIERHVKPLLGRLKADDVVRADIERFKAGVVTGKTAVDAKTGKRGRAIVTGGRGAATRALGLLGAIFEWGIAQGYVTTNPVRGVKRFKDGQRKTLLTADQYRALGSALDALAAKRTKNGHLAHHAYGLAAIRFIALSGARKGEIIALRWEELDVAGKCLRLADSKSGESVRPLGAAAMGVATSLERISDHVFAAGPKRQGYQGLPRLWELVQAKARPEGLADDDAGPLDGVTLHGLRHSFAGTADLQDCSLPTIAAMIGHTLAGVTSGYVLKRLDGPLIAAADRVSGHIAAMMDGQSEMADNVISITATA